MSTAATGSPLADTSIPRTIAPFLSFSKRIPISLYLAAVCCIILMTPLCVRSLLSVIMLGLDASEAVGSGLPVVKRNVNTHTHVHVHVSGICMPTALHNLNSRNLYCDIVIST